MTKFDILCNYTNAQIRDTWAALGKCKITNDTKIYTEGVLYELTVPVKNKSLRNSLIFCKKEYIGIIPWEDISLLDFNSGEVSFGNNIVSPNFNLMLLKDELDNIIEPSNPNFIPFSESKSNGAHVHISDNDYNLCTRCLGSPFITEDELEYSKEEIIDLAIKPALERYFKYFPKTEIVCEPLTGKSQELEFPTGAYDVIHFSVQQKGATGAGMITNPLLRYWDEGMYSGGFGASINGNYHSSKAPKTLTNTFESMALGRAAQQAVVNYRTRYHLDKFQKVVYPQGASSSDLSNPSWCRANGEKKWFLRFYSNKGGVAEIHFAMYSLDFDDVEFARRPELLTLCSAEIKKLFGNLRSQVKSDIPGVVNYSSWITEANEDINKVEENWKSIVKYSSIIRGSL